VIITDVYMSGHVIEIELEPSLGDGLLNTLAVGRVAGRARASLALVDEAADLIRRAPRVLLAGAEAVHSVPAEHSPADRSAACPSAVACDDGGDDDGDDDSRGRCTLVKSLRSRWNSRRSPDGDHDDDDDDDDDGGDGNGTLRRVARS